MKNIRILIADDHQLVREGVRRLIERQPGWEVCGTAMTGRQAVEQAENLDPDVVVLDMGMPGLNGLEVAREIKRRSRPFSLEKSRSTLILFPRSWAF